MRTLYVELDEATQYVDIYTDEKYRTAEGRAALELGDYSAAIFRMEQGRFAYMYESAHPAMLGRIIEELSERPIDERFIVPALGLDGATLGEVLQKLIDNQQGAQ